MAERADRFHPLPDLPSTATAPRGWCRVPRPRPVWYLLDPAEPICLYCALPTRLRDHAACVTPSVAHVFAPHGLATPGMPWIGPRSSRRARSRNGSCGRSARWHHPRLLGAARLTRGPTTARQGVSPAVRPRGTPHQRMMGCRSARAHNP